MRLAHYDRWDTYLDDLVPVSEVTRTRALDEFSDELEFKTFQEVTKGDRIVLTDLAGDVREYEVISLDSTRKTGKPALTVYATDAVAELEGAWVDSYEGGSDSTAADYLAAALDGTRWSVGECDESATAALSFEHTDALSMIEEVIEEFGLELSTAYTLDSQGTHVSGRYVSLCEQLGGDAGRRFSYGKDLRSIRRTVSSDRVITRCYGYDSDGNGLSYIGFNNDYLDAGNADEWGIPDANGDIQPVCAVYVGDSITDAAEGAAALLAAYKTPVISYEADVAAYVDAGLDMDALTLGDTVQIVDTCFPTALRLEGRVLKIVEDLAGGAKSTEVTLGNIIDSTTKVQRKITLTASIIK